MNRRSFILNGSMLLAASAGGIFSAGWAKQGVQLPHTDKMPVMFVGHGSPMHAINRDSYHETWRSIGRLLPKPHAILVISAHWRTLGTTRIMSTEEPETMHDFQGFPERLYRQQYPAPGSPTAARLSLDFLQREPFCNSEFKGQLDDDQGLDHGTWCVLLAMYPKADIPVFQISIDMTKPSSFHYHIGKKLAGLRERGVIIIGSGNLIHNLSAAKVSTKQPYDWALSLESELTEALAVHKDQALISAADTHARRMKLAHPTMEHYYPLLYALGAKSDQDQIRFFNTGFTRSSISMRSVIYSV